MTHTNTVMTQLDDKDYITTSNSHNYIYDDDNITTKNYTTIDDVPSLAWRMKTKIT